MFVPPGLGKSTLAQLLSREHGFVYYECDCFLGCRNPYIPPDVENPTLAQGKQKKLIGEGAEERERLTEKISNVMKAIFKGEKWDIGVWEFAVRELCKNIARERARLGGDWAIAGVLFTPRLRQIARFAKSLDSNRYSINLAQITHHKSPIFKSGKCHIGLGPYITISCIKDTFMFSRLILQAIYDICPPPATRKVYWG